MAQNLLVEVQTRVTQLKEMRAQREKLKKQISEKEQEMVQFLQDWKDNCKHVFYRVQRLSHVTVGFRCCLCGKYQEYAPPIHNDPRWCNRIIIIHTSRESEIGTVTVSAYAPTSYPIPPEYQVKVDSKNERLRKLRDERSTLEKELKALETSIKLSETGLNEISHLLHG